MTAMPTTWFPLELTHPLMLLGLAALLVLGWYFYRSLVDFARWQRLLSLACRALIVALLALALAELALLRPTREQFVVFAVDESLSVGGEGRQQAESFLDRAVAAAGHNRVAFLSFAADTGQVHSERGR